ncbi:MAG: hypothetical protein RL345_307 [Chloroflexota bacterium]|nr:ABC transporter permease [Chloroflexota bacterium]NBX47171.1 ABC transporter permease [Chloroflexota bacterium]
MSLPYAVRTVVRRARALTGMVIGVGIALGIGMLLLGVTRAKTDLYISNFVKTHIDMYVVQQGGTLVPVLPSDTTGAIPKASGVLAQIRSLREVRSAIGMTLASLTRDADGATRADEPTPLVTVMGVDGYPGDIDGLLVLADGRWLRRPDEIVVGDKLSRETGLRTGTSLRLSGRSFNVVGVGRLRGTAFGTDGYAYLDYQALRQRIAIPDAMNLIAVALHSPVAGSARGADPAAQAVRDRLNGIAAVSLFDTDQLVEASNRIMSAGVFFSWMMIGLTLAIAALFVSTVLGRSVAERRIEFATLRAIGLSRWTILATVAGEAALICILAAVGGSMMASVLGGWTNRSIAPQYGIEVLYVEDPPMFATLLVVSVVVGLVSGLIPARQATSVDPVEVLRDA